MNEEGELDQVEWRKTLSLHLSLHWAVAPITNTTTQHRLSKTIGMYDRSCSQTTQVVTPAKCKWAFLNVFRLWGICHSVAQLVKHCVKSTKVVGLMLMIRMPWMHCNLLWTWVPVSILFFNAKSTNKQYSRKLIDFKDVLWKSTCKTFS